MSKPLTVKSTSGRANEWGVLMRKRRLVRFWSQMSALCLLVLSLEWSNPINNASALQGLTRRVNIGISGEETNDYSGLAGSVSGNGERVVFESSASNLVAPDTNGVRDVFVRDVPENWTLRASVASDGSEANGWSGNPSISQDGRYIGFESEATNLIPNDTNGHVDVFVHDLVSGITTRVSVASDGTQGDAASYSPQISADGSHVAFLSRASNLVAQDTNGFADAFVHNIATGATTRASVAWNGAEPDGGIQDVSISGNGLQVAFESVASNLVIGDLNGPRGQDVFVRDLQAQITTMVSVSSDEVQGNCCSLAPDISDDGRYVVFESFAPNLVLNDTNLSYDVFLRDLVAGETQRISLGEASQEANGASYNAVISGDGTVVSFQSAASNLVESDVNGSWDIFIRDLEGNSTSRVSVSSAGAESNGWSGYPYLSHDGRYVIFASAATNLVESDTNGFEDVFLHDGGETLSPEISSLIATPQAFSPNGDGSSDTTTFSFTLTDESPPIAWSVEIIDSEGIQVRGWSGSSDSGDAIGIGWDGTNESGGALPDDTYGAMLTATDGWGNVAAASIDLEIDRIPPPITTIIPTSHSNTVFGNQPLLARVWDSGSGISSQLIYFDLIDETSGTSVSIGASTYESSTGWARTSNIELQYGHTYRVQVVATDRAGNRSALANPDVADGGGFLVVQFSPAASTASIPASTCQIEDDPDSDLFNLATCESVPLDLAAASVWMSGTRHGHDYGFIEHTVSLESAQLRKPGSSSVLDYIDAYNADDPAWQPRDVALRFLLPSQAEMVDGQTLAVEGRTVTIGPLIVQNVPLSWGSSAELLMSGADTHPVSGGQACPDPSVHGPFPFCTPDPSMSRYFVQFTPTADGDTRSITQRASDQLSGYLASISLIEEGDEGSLPGYEVDLPLTEAKALASHPEVEKIYPRRSIDAYISRDVSFRKGLYFQAVETYVVSLYRNPGSNAVRTDTYGALFTSEELAEVRRRIALEDDAPIIEAYVSANALEPDYGGIYLDHEAGGKHVVLFKSNLATHQSALNALVNDSERLEVRETVFSLTELVEAMEAIHVDFDVLRQNGFDTYSTGIDTKGKVAVVVGKEMTEGGCQFAEYRYDSRVAVYCTTSGPPTQEQLAFPPGVDPGVNPDAPEVNEGDGSSRHRANPPWKAGILGTHRPPIGDPRNCTVGFRVNNSNHPNNFYMLTAAHCGEGSASGGYDDVFNAEKHVGLIVNRRYNASRGVDMAAIRIQSPNEAKARVYRVFPNTLPVKNMHDRNENQGYIRCTSGAIYPNFDCGKVLAAPYNPRGLIDNELWNDLVCVSGPHEVGDSGAPVWTPEENTGNARASGIHFGGCDEIGAFQDPPTTAYSFSHLTSDGTFSLGGYSIATE